MNLEEQLTPVERRFGARLKETRVGPCLTAQDIVELTVLGRRSPHYEARIEHVVSCAACRQLLSTFRTVEAQAERQPDSRSVNAPAIRRPLVFGALAVAVACLLLFLLYRGRRDVVVLNDAGSRIALNAAGQLTGLPNLPPDERELAVQMLRTGRIPPSPVLATLHAPAATAADRPTFDVHAPRDTVVEARQPEFSWQMPTGAVSCRIMVTCVTDAKNRIRTKPLTAEHWKPKRPLTPGLIYQWQVIALDRAGHEVARVPAQTGAVRFKVLESDRTALLTEYRRRFGQSHLALGTRYAHEGLLDAAEKEFQALARENSASDTARNLLQSLHNLRDKTS